MPPLYIVLCSHLDSFVDAFHHNNADVGVSVAEPPRAKLLLLLVYGLTHEHVRKSFTVDEFDKVECVTLCRQWIRQRPTALFLFLEYLQYETIKRRRINLIVFISHRFTHTYTYTIRYRSRQV